MPFVFYSLMFGSVAILGLASYPPVIERVRRYLRHRVAEATFRLDDMFLSMSAAKVRRLYVVVPIGLGTLVWLFTGSWWIGLIGGVVGVVLPKLLIVYAQNARLKKLHAQLVDALLVLSSCLRAGLSMMQSFNVVAEEMPRPIRDEFGLVLKETRMGIDLDEAMGHFKQRAPFDDANLFVTAVLVARETGGDITAIFTKLVSTLRERNKIRERIKTLTFMAKMQGLVMALLPVVFVFVTYSMDRNHFQFFLTDPMGRLFLAGVVMAQIFSVFLFLRFSRSPL